MRKITQEAATHFEQRMTFNKSNTVVKCGYGRHEKTGNLKGQIEILSLFGNDIAIKINNRLFITNCGYFTNTTKERLNGLTGVNISQKKGVWYLNGKEWNGKTIEIK